MRELDVRRTHVVWRCGAHSRDDRPRPRRGEHPGISAGAFCISRVERPDDRAARSAKQPGREPPRSAPRFSASSTGGTPRGSGTRDSAMMRSARAIGGCRRRP